MLNVIGKIKFKLLSLVIFEETIFSPRYCQRLPCDEFTVLVPSFKVRKIPKDNPGNLGEVIYTDDEDEDHNFNYICSLSLPFNCPIKEIIEVG